MIFCCLSTPLMVLLYYTVLTNYKLIALFNICSQKQIMTVVVFPLQDEWSRIVILYSWNNYSKTIRHYFIGDASHVYPQSHTPASLKKPLSSHRACSQQPCYVENSLDKDGYPTLRFPAGPGTCTQKGWLSKRWTVQLSDTDAELRMQFRMPILKLRNKGGAGEGEAQERDRIGKRRESKGPRERDREKCEKC